MTTRAHDVTRYIAREWETYYASAVLSGIVGDAAHQAGGGYHISIEDNRSTNYSVIRPDDKAPPGDWDRTLAAAIDMSMNPSDMKLCSSRLWNIWNDKTDPRREYLNGFNGWFNDGGPAKRYDFVTQAISTTTSDHKWHVHNEIRRRWVTSMIAANAILSGLRGETKQQYLAGGSTTQGDDDMFANYGDGNPPNPPSEKVIALQERLLQLDPTCLPKFGSDGGYGDETATAVLRFLGPEITADGKKYQGKAFAMLEKLCEAKNGSGGSVTLPSNITVSGTMTGTMSGDVSGTLTIDK